jgi:hypothetical protein
MIAGVEMGDGSGDWLLEDVVDSLSESGAVVAVVVDWLSGSMTVDGRADGVLG